jgi:DNA-binding LytR/AlgR family response regulator
MQDFLFIKHDGGYKRILFSELIYIESNRNYIKFVTNSKVLITLGSLKSLMQLLPKDKFCRVHRSYAVSLDRVSFFHVNILRIDISTGKNNLQKLPIGNEYRKAFIKKFKFIYRERKESEYFPAIRSSGNNYSLLMQQ